MTSERAKSPISNGMMDIPLSRFTILKVKRRVVMVGSRPTVASNRPRLPDMSPLIIDLPATPATIVREKIISMAISGGPNRRAMEARGAATAMSTRSEQKSAKVEEYLAILSAFTPLPCLVRVYPSRTVHAEAGVPGVFRRMAVIEPPKIPPLYAPTSSMMDVTKSRSKVIGNIRATAIVAVRPGMVPTIRPRVEPTMIARMCCQCRIMPRPTMRFSNIVMVTYSKIKPLGKWTCMT